MKKEIKRILVPVDFTETSDNAVEEAVLLARLLGADIYLIHVIESLGYHYSVVPEMKTVLLSPREFEMEVVKKLEKLQERIKQEYGIKVETHVTNGNIHSQIIDYGMRNGVDLIVMGTHGASGFREIFIGSNAQRVVTLSPFPVLTIQKKKEQAGFRNILLPIDDSVHSREKVNIAIAIANAFAAKIRIIGLPDSADPKEMSKFNIKLASVEKMISAARLLF
ncbi:MAG TPA: universal stress protein, partial [Bacteroidia bacterium]|nr:universal stress protein [Bacteroidia bacterium]